MQLHAHYHKCKLTLLSNKQQSERVREKNYKTAVISYIHISNGSECERERTKIDKMKRRKK
jgi:hypothetical protein